MDRSKKIVGDKTINSEILSVDNIVCYSRSMVLYNKDIFDAWNEKYNEYYIYFIDGDNWGKQKRWIDRDINPDYIDKEAAYMLNNLITYKDSMMMFSDEFLLISEKDLDNDINDLNRILEYTVSSIKMNNSEFIYDNNVNFKESLRPYFYTLKKIKNENGKGIIYKGGL